MIIFFLIYGIPILDVRCDLSRANGLGRVVLREPHLSSQFEISILRVLSFSTCTIICFAN